MPASKPPPQPAPSPPDKVAIHAVLIAVRQAAQLLCDRATLLVLLHAHGGACRYAEFSEQTGLASRLLSSRLARLTEDGLLVRIPYSRRPLRHAYHLTHMGVALFDVLALLVTWEESWPGSAAARQMVRIVHLDCTAADGKPESRPTTVHMHCAACGEPVTPREIALRVSHTEMARMPAHGTTTRRTSQDAGYEPGNSTSAVPQGLAVLGDKWSIEVLVCAHFGMRQFGDFGARIGISTNILSDRLSRLVNGGLLRRSTEEEPHRKGLYLLTPKGRGFYSILVVIQSWADQWIDHRVRSPVKLIHVACHKLLKPLLICSCCGREISHAQAKVSLAAQAGTTPAATTLPNPAAPDPLPRTRLARTRAEWLALRSTRLKPPAPL